MNGFLKQSTATTIILGPFADNADGASLETGLTISQADVRLSKNAGAFAQKNDSNAATHMENAQYSCALNTTDTGTLGMLRVTVYESGALIWWADYMVIPANVYDSLFAGSDKLQVHTDEITANLINAAALAADAVTEIQNGLATSAALQVVDDFVDELESRLTSTRAGYLDNLSGGAVATASALSTVAGYIDTEVAAILAAVDTEIGAIKAKTDNLPSDPADDSDIDAQLATIAGYLDTEVAAILAAVDTEIGAIKAKTDNLPASPAAVGSAMTLVDGAVTEAKFSSGGLNAIADAILKRDWTAVSGEASRSVLNALRFLRNKWTAIGATLTVSKEDDSTTAWSAVITKDAASDPITGSDPV